MVTSENTLLDTQYTVQLNYSEFFTTPYILPKTVINYKQFNTRTQLEHAHERAHIQANNIIRREKSCNAASTDCQRNALLTRSFLCRPTL